MAPPTVDRSNNQTAQLYGYPSIRNFESKPAEDTLLVKSFVSEAVQTSKESNTTRLIANHPECLPNKLGESLWPHLQNCFDNDVPLISFHSQLGFMKCCHLLGKPDKPNPGEPKKPSALQMILQHGVKKTLNGKTQAYEVTLHTQDGPITLSLKHPPVTGNEDTLPYIKAKIDVTVGGNSKQINVIEMAPKFDGKALNSPDLVTCYKLAEQFKKECMPKDKQPDGQQPKTVPGQFASAKGVGRSASLLVMSQFEELLPQLISAHKNTKELNIASVVKDLIRANRDKLKMNQFVHTIEQQKQLIEACQTLYNEAIEVTRNSNEQPTDTEVKEKIRHALETLKHTSASKFTKSLTDNLAKVFAGINQLIQTIGKPRFENLFNEVILEQQARHKKPADKPINMKETSVHKPYTGVIDL